MPFTLRRMAPGDDAVFDRVAPHVFDDPVDPEHLRTYLASPWHMMVLALDGDLVVGQCAAVIHHHPDKPDSLYIDEVGTASTHRRQGIATAMMREMLAWARERGCHDAWLGTELDNLEANGLYEKIKLGPGQKMVYYEFDL